MRVRFFAAVLCSIWCVVNSTKIFLLFIFLFETQLRIDGALVFHIKYRRKQKKSPFRLLRERKKNNNNSLLILCSMPVCCLHKHVHSGISICVWAIFFTESCDIFHQFSRLSNRMRANKKRKKHEKFVSSCRKIRMKNDAKKKKTKSNKINVVQKQEWKKNEKRNELPSAYWCLRPRYLWSWYSQSHIIKPTVLFYQIIQRQTNASVQRRRYIVHVFVLGFIFSHLKRTPNIVLCVKSTFSHSIQRIHYLILFYFFFSSFNTTSSFAAEKNLFFASKSVPFLLSHWMLSFQFRFVVFFYFIFRFCSNRSIFELALVIFNITHKSHLKQCYLLLCMRKIYFQLEMFGNI